MTTIIVIVVVALVFFVTVCVITFMVWKREAEMRTDSIRAIENNLERLGDRLTAEIPPEEYEPLQEGLHQESCRTVQEPDPPVVERSRRARNTDPFGWVRREPGSQESRQPDEMTAEAQRTERQTETEPEVRTQQEPLQQPADMRNGQESPESPEMPELSEDRKTAEKAEDTGRSVPQLDPDVQPAIEQVSGENSPRSALQDAEVPDTAETTEEDFTPMEIELPDPDLFTGLGTLDVHTEGELPAQPSKQSGRDVGRSGKKYTAEELEMLIKE